MHRPSAIPQSVAALRARLGSAVRPLSFADLARLISADHPGTVSTTTVYRWELGSREPDLHSLRIMADLAGVSMEAFAFGASASPDAIPQALIDALPAGTVIRPLSRDQLAAAAQAEAQAAADAAGAQGDLPRPRRRGSR
jgi:transcriptional regulator with XRE-family HTH domain